MRSKPEVKSVSKKNNSKRSLIGVIIGMVLLAGVVTVLSMQKRQNAIVSKSEEGSDKLKTKSAKPYVTTDEKGHLIVLDRQTGQARDLKDDEANRLASGLKDLIKDTDEGLVEVHRENGMVSMDLDGHYHNVMMAKVEDDGSISQTCINNLENAARFFEIDPKLVGIDKPISTTRKSTELEER